MRNPVACVSCRSAKQRCLHDDAPPCERCKAAGRAEQCEFPLPGTSAIHRRPKRPRIDDTTATTAGTAAASTASTVAMATPTFVSITASSPASGGGVLSGAGAGAGAGAGGPLGGAGGAGGGGSHQPPAPASAPASAPTPVPAASFAAAAHRRVDAPNGIISPSASGGAAVGHSPSPISTTTASQLDGLDPFDLLTDEVKNSYLRCSYKWSFHHTPTLLLRIRDRTLEPWMAWAILALAIRFVKDPPPPFATQKEASNAFAAYARQILQSDLETPSISRVQALLMLTGHDWGAGNGRRAWIYLGMAIRLVEVMDLCREPDMPKNRKPTREEFIEAEVRRRTAWTCFLMDSLLSGGKGRKRSLTASDMAIQLPCEKENFVFGDVVCTAQLDGSLRMPPLSQSVGELGIIAHSLRAANIWGKIARWACSDTVNSEFPWSPTSEFQQLIYDLQDWRLSLPVRLQYDLFSLHSHNAVDQGQAYCYMHCISFMGYMFLHRAYLPVLGPQSSAEETPRAYHEHRETWKNWQNTSRKELLRESTMVLEMLEEMRTFGVYFLRGLVPWIGFTIYTAVGVMLYHFNFPSAEDDPKITEKARERVIKGCTFLKDMKTQWPMADTWFETIKRMQAYYRSALGHEAPVSSDERQALRCAMIDYGALQPSPVHKPVEASSSNESTHVRTSFSHEHPQSTPLISPPTSTTTPNGYMSTSTTTSYWTPAHQAVPPLEADETFDLDFSFGFESAADMEALMMNATQDFWASFPGEVGGSPL